MRKILIVGNWKMHLNASEASLLVHRLNQNIDHHENIEVVLAPSSLTLQPLSVQIDRRKFRLASQNAYFKDEGAFTGEISFNMLRELVHYAIVGHSERRRYFNEDLVMVRDKVKAAVRNHITPILCVGETKVERTDGETRQVLHDQVLSALANLTVSEVGDLVIAYEPVWAIGVGQAATPLDVKTATGFIRELIEGLFGAEPAREIRILYGGSVSPELVGGFLDGSGVDGFLVGHESLNYAEFSAIVNNTYAWQRKGGE